MSSISTCLNFDAVPTGTYTGIDLSALFPGITFGNRGVVDYVVSDCSSILLQADFTCGNAIRSDLSEGGTRNFAILDESVCDVSLTMGDYNDDGDFLELFAYDENDDLVGSDSYSNPALTYAGKTLKVDDWPACRIKQVLFLGTRGLAVSNIYWDNFCFTPTDNTPPVAQCKDATLSAAGPGCEATPSVSDINDNSYDPDGDDITYAISPSGPFAAGTTTPVTLTVTDEFDSTDTCVSYVSVVDDEDPQVDCGSLGVIVPGETPVSGYFEAIKDNGCPVTVATSHDKCQFCNGAENPTDRDCVVETSGSDFTIHDAGGAKNHISFTVTATNDNSGSAGTRSDTKTCTICVQSNRYICEGDYPNQEFECGAGRFLRA